MFSTEYQDAAALAEIAAAIYLKSPSPEVLVALKNLLLDSEVELETPDLLQQEYHELFFNPASEHFLCPFESFAREQRYWGECAVAVGEVYQQAGFDPESLLSDEHWQHQRMPDHIGFELAFFSALLRSAEAQSSEAEALLETARLFHREHIQSWMGEFSSRLSGQARTSLYRMLGVLTREIADLSLPVTG